MMAEHFGLDAQRKKTREWGGSDGISGGGHQYHQVELNRHFQIKPSPLNSKNVKTDKPYDSHINQ